MQTNMGYSLSVCVMCVCVMCVCVYVCVCVCVCVGGIEMNQWSQIDLTQGLWIRYELGCVCTTKGIEQNWSPRSTAIILYLHLTDEIA